MAVIMEGDKFTVHDDSYRDASPEEIERRLRYAQSVAQGIMARYAARVAAGEQEPIHIDQ